MHEIVRLKQHVAELGVAHAGVAPIEPAADRILRQHNVDGKVLADVAEEFQVAELSHPIVVVHQDCRSRAAIEIQKPPQLGLHAGDIRLERFDRKQFAFLALAARVADHARGAADHSDRPMPRLLKPPQDHQRHQMPDVQAIGRRIEARVHRSRLFHEQLRQIRVVGGLID